MDDSNQLKSLENFEPLRRTGIQFESIQANEIDIRMPLEGNTNHLGTMYAGSLFALAECAAGVLFIQRFGIRKFGLVCSNVNIRFRRPATTDIKLSMYISEDQFNQLEQHAMEYGKAEITFEQELLDSERNVVSVADTTYVLIKL